MTALLLGGSAVILPSLIPEGHADYARVVSIKETHDYQDPALLKKAWTLPVAAAYQASIDFECLWPYEPGQCTALAQATGKPRKHFARHELLHGAGLFAPRPYP